MKHIARFCLGVVACIAVHARVIAAPMTVPNTFTAGTPARAGEVNANFSAVVTAVNDKDTRLTTLETNAARPDVAPSGNVVLGISTPTSGNIIKNAQPFMHDTGLASTFLGSGAGNFTTTGEDNSAFGFNALSGLSTGESNTAMGTSALSRNSSGSANTAVGTIALPNNTVGQRNSAIGYAALYSNTTGNDNTAIGPNALTRNTTGLLNTAVGVQALAFNTAATANTALGANALYMKAGAGDLNTAIGTGALSYLNSGSRNIALGPFAGGGLRSGDDNIYVGGLVNSDESDTIRIGTSQTRTFVAGIRGVTTANLNAVPVVIDSQGQLGTVSSSRRYKDDIADMGDASSLLMRLRPVTFHYRSDRNPSGRTLQYGLVAEEVADVAPGLVARSGDGEIETVYYQFLPPMLLNELQKQQRVLEAQQARLAQLEREIAVLRKQAAH